MYIRYTNNRKCIFLLCLSISVLIFFACNVSEQSEIRVATMESKVDLVTKQVEMSDEKYISEETKNNIKNDDKLVISYELDINDRKHTLKIGNVDTYVAFGKYITGRNDELNDLYWLVAYKDEAKKKALLLTKEAIDCIPYNDKDEVITWENSYLREWMNYDFYNLAFSDIEKKKIIKTFHINSDEEYGGNDTYDNVFALSKNEVLQYMPYGHLACSATNYAVKEKRAYSEKSYNGKSYTNYLIRTPAQNGYSTMTVFTDGQMYPQKMVNAKTVAIRPSIWVYYDDLDEEVNDVKQYTNIASTYFLIATSNDEDKINKLNELPVTNRFKESHINIDKSNQNYYILNLSEVTQANDDFYYSISYDKANRIIRLNLERCTNEERNQDGAIVKEFVYRYYLDDGGYLDDIELLQVNDYFDENNNRIYGKVKFNKYNYVEILSYLIPGKSYFDQVDGLPVTWSDIIDSFNLTDRYKIMHEVKDTLFNKEELVNELLKNKYINNKYLHHIDTSMFEFYGMDVVYDDDKDIFESFDDKKVILRLDVDEYRFYLDVNFEVVGDALDDISVILIKATTIDEEKDNDIISFVYGKIKNEDEKVNRITESGIEINDSVNTVDIGKYYYYPDKYKPLTGKEEHNHLNLEKYPIRWNILDYDKKNGKALVITNSIIDARKFNDSNKYANWADCSLRQWLNGAFYENTFTDNEKEMILTSTLETNDAFLGDTCTTKDKIFLLDIIEVKKYFNEWKDRICKPTPYARNMLPEDRLEYTMDVPGANDYYLRDCHYISKYNGNDWGGLNCDYGVRPAMWIKVGNVKVSDNFGYILHGRYKTLINELFDKDIIMYDNYPVSDRFKKENIGGLFKKYQLMDDDEHTYNIYVDTEKQAIKIVEYVAKYDKEHYIGCKKGREINLMYSLDSERCIDKIIQDIY